MRFWCALISALLLGTQSMAISVEKLPTVLGEVWFVEAPQLPMVSVLLSFRAGSAFDPADKSGLANYAATVLEETGAGPYSMQALKDQIEDIGAQISIGAGKLDFTVEITTLKEHLPRALELTNLILTQSHFSEADALRVREALTANLKQSLEDPQTVAGRTFVKALYGTHPYGQYTSGTEESLARLTAADAKTFIAQQLHRGQMKVSVIGQITPSDITNMLNKYLGNLPVGDHKNAIASAPQDPEPQVLFTLREVPQAAVFMGHLGTNLHVPDRFAVMVLNYILGGGGFSSRLMEEVREKRGLAYGVYSSFDYLPFKGGFSISLQTKNESVDEAVALVRKEMHEVIDRGVTADEYQAAIDYLTGSFPLRLDTNSKILDNLDLLQTEDLPESYLDTWVANVRKVTRADVQKAARKYLHPDKMVIVVVGGKKPAIAQNR